MKRNIRRAVLVLGTSLAMPLAACAVEATNGVAVTNAIAIDALVADVLAHNPELGFYRAEIAAAKGGRRTAGALANPEVAAQLGRKAVRGGGTSDEGVAWSVSVQQPFEWPGRMPLRKAIANQQVQLAELGLKQFEGMLASKVRLLAFNLAVAEQKAAVAREVADRFQALREVLVTRDPAGLTPVLETRIIESTEITLHRKVSEHALETHAALLELNQLRGQSLDSPLRVRDEKVDFAPVPNTEALAAAARTNNFELRMRATELEQQGLRISLARNERWPTVSVGPFFSQERAGDVESIAGLGVAMPLPLWNGNKGGIETARARELQAQTSLYVAVREIERKVTEQALRYQTRLVEISKWRPDSIEQFREAATLADRHYRLGAVPIATYVELQKQYLEAVETLLDTKRDALEAGQQLRLLTGLELNVIHTKPAEAK